MLNLNSFPSTANGSPVARSRSITLLGLVRFTSMTDVMETGEAFDIGRLMMSFATLDVASLHDDELAQVVLHAEALLNAPRPPTSEPPAAATPRFRSSLLRFGPPSLSISSRQAMRREPSDASAPDRYRVAVVVRHDHTDLLPLACCDSPAFRVVIGADSEVLDVGRITQQWPIGIRRAITHRDRQCVFPGCDRPPSWCDIHHCLPWEEGGSTSIDNGAAVVSTTSHVHPQAPLVDTCRTR